MAFFYFFIFFLSFFFFSMIVLPYSKDKVSENMYPIYKVYSDRLRLSEDNDTRQLGNAFHTDIDLGTKA